MHTTMFFRKQEEGLQIFVKGWELYRKIIECNYMKHREVVSILRSAVLDCRSDVTSVLEVGCGDAHAVSNALEGAPAGAYTGVDMSQHALDYAKKNLAGLKWRLDLRAGNMFEVVPQLDSSFDMILAGYSLHHFGSDRKEILLRRFRELIADGGQVIVYDLYRHDQEDRNAYLERLLAVCRRSWSDMSAEQMDQIHDHVRNNDHPESLDSIKRIGESCGFSEFECLYRDPDELYGVVRLR